eukprot:TRINITY_DN35683_c0_g1_i1.p1 TRINITY_DN35683_c0_g1~~TRINITY_DN35683_c0_g1_i1.p1  ORF type:complete len:106 (-),score=26.10 TRINITY_DN35683_c0_g1_i1:367-684(-)
MGMASCTTQGMMAKARSQGQPSSFPSTSLSPRTCPKNIPEVTASWLNTPRPPLKSTGAISDTYMGTSTVLSPAVNPTTSLPTSNTSQELVGLDMAMITPPSRPVI